MLEEAKVEEWMSTPVERIRPNTLISDAHQIMKEKNIRRLPILDKHERLVGIVTIGDIREASPSDATTLSIWELNYLWAKLTVEKVMTTKVLTVHPQDSMLDAAQIMLEEKVSGLPVVNSDKQLVGILTESDVFRMLVKSRVKT